MPISDELLAILACPRCRGKVILAESRLGLICNACRLFFRIEEDIPVMLVEEARDIDEL